MWFNLIPYFKEGEINIGIACFLKNRCIFPKILYKANWLAVIFIDVLLLFLVDQLTTAPEFSAIFTSRLPFQARSYICNETFKLSKKYIRSLKILLWNWRVFFFIMQIIWFQVLLKSSKHILDIWYFEWWTWQCGRLRPYGKVAFVNERPGGHNPALMALNDRGSFWNWEYS